MFALSLFQEKSQAKKRKKEKLFTISKEGNQAKMNESYHLSEVNDPSTSYLLFI